MVKAVYHQILNASQEINTATKTWIDRWILWIVINTTPTRVLE